MRPARNLEGYEEWHGITLPVLTPELALGQHFTRSACEPCARHAKHLLNAQGRPGLSMIPFRS